MRISRRGESKPAAGVAGVGPRHGLPGQRSQARARAPQEATPRPAHRRARPTGVFSLSAGGRVAQHRAAWVRATVAVANRSTDPGCGGRADPRGVIVSGSDSTIRCFALRAPGFGALLPRDGRTWWAPTAAAPMTRKDTLACSAASTRKRPCPPRRAGRRATGAPGSRDCESDGLGPPACWHLTPRPARAYATPFLRRVALLLCWSSCSDVLKRTLRRWLAD